LFLPVRDENPPRITPFVTWILLLVNIVIFFWIYSQGEAFYDKTVEEYAMVPIDILEGKNLHTMFTSMFLHADILHLFGNMLFLYIFGDNVEDAFGHGRYLLFYFLCGIAASLTHIISITNPSDLADPALGASGAISGVLGAYLILYPKARVITLVFFGWIFFTAIPAIIFLGFWFILQWLFAVYDIGGGVAYWAHIGGFLAGMLMAPLLKREQPELQ